MRVLARSVKLTASARHGHSQKWSLWRLCNSSFVASIFLKLRQSSRTSRKTQMRFLRVSLRRGSQQVRFSTRSHSWLSTLESRKRRGKKKEMKSMGKFVLPEAKETPPAEELEVSKRQSSSSLKGSMKDENEDDVMSDCEHSPLSQYSSDSDYKPVGNDSPDWPIPATPSFDWNANWKTEWGIASRPCTPQASLVEETCLTVPETAQPKVPIPPIVRNAANWQEAAKDLTRNKMFSEKYLDIFCRPISDSESNLPQILYKLQNNQFGTKSSFEFAINEIAEITQQTHEEESEEWWKSEYLKLFFRIHWDAVFNYTYTSDELSVMNWKLNKIHRKLQPDEKPLWTFSPERP